MFLKRNLTLRKKSERVKIFILDYHRPITEKFQLTKNFIFFSLFPSFSRGEEEVIDTKLF